MPADLSTSSVFRRVSFVIDEDCLIVLQHEQTRDRIQRVLFDRVESVVVWRTWPWVRMLLAGVILGVPALLLLLVQDMVTNIISGILLGIAVLVLARYAYCRKTLIRITRVGKTQDIAALQGPAKVQRFIQRLQTQIQITQNRAAQVAAAGTPPMRDLFAPPTPDQSAAPQVLPTDRINGLTS